MPVSGTRSRSVKRVTLPPEAPAAKEKQKVPEAADSITIQLTQLLTAREEQAAARANESYDKMDRRCAAMEEVHAKSQQDLQMEVRQLQKAVKQLGECRTEHRSGKSSSTDTHALMQEVSRLSETEAKGRAEAQERLYRLQSSVTGLATRIVAAEQVVHRLDALERIVGTIQSEIRHGTTMRKERARKEITVDLGKEKARRPPASTEPSLRDILKNWPTSRCEEMMDRLSDLGTTMPIIGQAG